ncbi:MAG TPA: FMN-binding protein [Jatrophihabitantaceae bacterium]|nr:FMN-binding protein [Jatrophihabitantaceae bacterium]
MKRILLSITGTVLGLVALLSFKSHGHPLRTTGALPSAGLPAASSTAPTGTSSSPGVATSAPPKPGAGTTKTLTGQAVETRYGIVQIQVTVTGSKINNVSFLQLTAFDDRSQQINQAAAPLLLQETLSAQNSQIDTVSGATYTSEGYIQSLQSALDQVGLK